MRIVHISSDKLNFLFTSLIGAKFPCNLSFSKNFNHNRNLSILYFLIVFISYLLSCAHRVASMNKIAKDCTWIFLLWYNDINFHYVICFFWVHFRARQDWGQETSQVVTLLGLMFNVYIVFLPTLYIYHISYPCPPNLFSWV